MIKLIGITGGMSSGKTTLCKKLIELNPDYIYVDVDDFRRNLYKNNEYIKELKSKIIELKKYKEINSLILNKYIYYDEENMNKYKETLYNYLFKYLNGFNNKTILVDWALIVNDKLLDKFNKIVYLDISEDIRLSRLNGSDLSKDEILRRFELQKINNIKKYENHNFMIVGEENMDVNKINSFINSMECKFTLPEDGGKAIWEITHNCNYGCSYCIFSCDKKRVDGELTTQECFHVIDELAKNGFKHLKITGGEPFIRKDLVEILEYASKKLIVDVSTNASLINDEIVKKLNKINLKMIHVSLDGNKEEHEAVRGKSTYERTINGLKSLKNSKNKIRIGSVIHAKNENNIENLVKDSINIGADEIIFSIMEPVDGQSKLLVKTISNEELIKTIDNIKEKYQDNIIINYNFGKQPTFVKECPAGDKFLYINNMGFISPCPWVYENNKNCISKISLRNNNLKDVLKDKNISLFLNKKSKGVCYGKIQ